MANLHKDLENDLKVIGKSIALRNTKDYYNDNITESEADEITIYNISEGFMQFYTYKLPKNKLVDLEWVMNKWSKSTDNTYESFTNNFKKILEAKGYKNSLNVYPTTYGIGIFVVFSARGQTNSIREDVESILDEYEIDYKTTTSEAGWVFQYRISKAKENIDKLKLINI